MTLVTIILMVLPVYLVRLFSAFGETARTISILISFGLAIYLWVTGFKRIFKTENKQSNYDLVTNDKSEKNITYLNSKVWYRFLKVVYILLFILVVLGLNLENYYKNGVKKVDMEKTRIYCNFQDQKIFSPKEIGYIFTLDINDFVDDKFDYEYFFKKTYNSYKIREILKECYTPTLDNDVDIFALQRHYEITGLKEAPREYKKEYLDSEIKKIEEGYKTEEQKANLLDFSIIFFDIKPVFSHNDLLKLLVVENILIVLFFEIIKRVFYYIVLGKIKPKK